MKLLLAFAIAFVATTTAVPAQLEKRVTKSQLDTFALYAHYAAAAYDDNNNDKATLGDKVACPKGHSCPLVEAHDTATLSEFSDLGDISDVTGFVAVDKTQGVIVVAFRGTKSVLDFVVDARFVQKDISWCTECAAHSGFWNAWVVASPTVFRAVTDARKANPGFDLIVTGHSLGGAMATFAAQNLRQIGIDTTLYTYGAPRIGNRALAAYISGWTGQNFRITHGQDIVAKLPPGFLGEEHQHHIYPEFWINTGPTEDAVSATNVVGPLSGTRNMSGNTGSGGVFETVPHGHYFGPISASSPDGVEVAR
ncbi:MAG: hypothetical protein M1833_005793 [Piccolia ochrophora]|nr:MAG: hypothetical protein M1833_005793 [Piccolia ochrophora]